MSQYGKEKTDRLIEQLDDYDISEQSPQTSEDMMNSELLLSMNRNSSQWFFEPPLMVRRTTKNSRMMRKNDGS